MSSPLDDRIFARSERIVAVNVTLVNATNMFSARVRHRDEYAAFVGQFSWIK
jgi:hypothetical protein